MFFCLMFSFQQQFKNADLPKGDVHVAEASHTGCRVQQRTHSAVPGVSFQPVRVEVQRLRRC